MGRVDTSNYSRSEINHNVQQLKAYRAGPVATDPTHELYMGAEQGSNNTAEITAMIEAFIFITELKHNQKDVELIEDGACARLGARLRLLRGL